MTPIRSTPKRKLIFTITTGRSSTAYLTELLRSNSRVGEFHHEIVGWDHFGVDTPDLSHLTQFNTRGNTSAVKDFWARKFDVIGSGSGQVYCETSHVLAKCGLIENLGALDRSCEVHVVALRRDVLATASSLRRRGDFINYGNMWMWYLDPRYPRNLTAIRGEETASNLCVWYVIEMRTRAEYYRRLLEGVPGVILHQATLEEIVRPDGARALLDALGVARSTSRILVPPVKNKGVHVMPLTAGDEVILRGAATAADQADVVGMAERAYEKGFRF